MTVRDISAHLTEPYGELDLATTPELCARIDSIRQRRARALILDLPGTDFCDSTGLRALRDSHRTLAIQRARLIVIVPPDGPWRGCSISPAHARCSSCTRRSPPAWRRDGPRRREPRGPTHLHPTPGQGAAEHAKQAAASAVTPRAGGRASRHRGSADRRCVHCTTADTEQGAVVLSRARPLFVARAAGRCESTAGVGELDERLNGASLHVAGRSASTGVFAGDGDDAVRPCRPAISA